MPTINHTITVTVNGTDRSSLLLKDSLYIRTSVGNNGDSASFSLRDATGVFTPLDWDEVTIDVNATRVFGGYITNRQASGIGSGSTKTAVWEVECRDWAALLDTVVIDRSYVDTADTAILSGLFSLYLPGEGFDATTNVTAVDSDIDIGFENVTLREALNLLADVAGAKWHIAPNKSLYWYAPTAPANAAFNIDVVSPNNSTTYDVLADSLRYGIDANTIVNEIRVIGGEEESGKVTDTFAANGTKDTFGPFTQKPGSVWKVTFTMAGVLHTNFSDRIGYEPGDSLSIDGGDYNTLVNLESRHVKIKKTNGSVPDNATNVTITYYALTPVDVTVEDAVSQSEYNRVFEQTVYDESLTSTALAQDYGERVISEYAYGRETIKFDVTEHGLLPGRLITINAPVLGAPSTYDAALALENRQDVLLLEDGTSRLLLENYGESRKYLIQDVTIRTVVTGSNQFMVIATVSCGKYVTTLIDSLSGIQGFSAGTGRLPAQRTVGRLDRLANDLGEIVAGRATFTDGGTAPFTWDAYNDHTGAVIGLEEDGSNAYGALYILNDGTVQAKLGYLTGLPAVTGGTPTGWGLYTTNGYFRGVITASQMIGGTIATTVMPINSSNPGVYMTSAGIFAYGTLGLTFSLPSDPAQRPIFSSGTILNTIYEVSTSSILRTGTTNPRVQIDNSGIFAYDSGGTARFTVDATTGRLTASQGTFSGTVSASTVSGGTVTGAVFTGGTVTQGTVSAAVVSGGTVTGAQISGGTVTGGLVSGGTVSGALVTGGSVSSAGGSVVINSEGINIASPGAYSYNDIRNIKWRRSVGGSVNAEVSGNWNGSQSELRMIAGFANHTYGILYTEAWNNSGFGYTQLQQYPTQWTWLIDGNSKLQLDTNLTSWVNIIPDNSGSARQLGDSTHAYRYLFLYDGTDEWRIAINTSGVITTTKV